MQEDIFSLFLNIKYLDYESVEPESRKIDKNRSERPDSESLPNTERQDHKSTFAIKDKRFLFAVYSCIHFSSNLFKNWLT